MNKYLSYLLVTAISFLFLFLILGCHKENSDASVGSTGSNEFIAGELAPTFTLQDLSGKNISLESFHNKIVLLNFWATWCAPCVAEMPALERLYKSLKNQGFEILAINEDAPEDISAVQTFVKNNGLTFTVVRDPQMKVARSYKVSGFPETFFVNPTGKFLALVDPQNPRKNKLVRFLSDRAWDSPAYLKLISNLVKPINP